MRTVLLSKFVPWPPNSGEKRRTLALARRMLELGPVTVVAFEGDHEDAAGLRAQGFEVRAVRLERTIAKTLVGLVRMRTLSGARFWDPALARELRSAESSGQEVSLTVHAQLLPYRRTGVPGFRVLDMQNIESGLARRMARASSGLRRLAYAIDAAALRRLERRAVEATDAVSVVSKADLQALERETRVVDALVVPNAWDATVPLPPATEPVVSFVALLSWGPNVDAAVWLLDQVWPRVLDAVPEARLQLVGREPAESILQRRGPSIVVSGSVESLAPWYESSLVCLAPLLAGGGSRLKILEALAAGRPVVATSVGVEGLEDLVGRGVVVADGPSDVAARIVELLRSPESATALGRAGARAVDEDHTWASAIKPLIERVSSHLTITEGAA